MVNEQAEEAKIEDGDQDDKISAEKGGSDDGLSAEKEDKASDASGGSMDFFEE